jgi:hypothetical protein
MKKNEQQPKAYNQLSMVITNLGAFASYKKLRVAPKKLNKQIKKLVRMIRFRKDRFSSPIPLLLLLLL